MAFDCVQCGACCRMIGDVAELRDLDRGDGTCKHLTDENLCQIYNQRPPICRVDLMRPPVVTEAYWNEANRDACAKLHLHVYGQPISR